MTLPVEDKKPAGIGYRVPAVPNVAAISGSPDAIVREPEVLALTGLSPATRQRLTRAGKFPQKRKISPGCGGWIRSEIMAWIADLQAKT